VIATLDERHLDRRGLNGCAAHRPPNSPSTMITFDCLFI
jgi:hypothetical protein